MPPSHSFTVSGPNGGPYTITFEGELGDRDVPRLEANGEGLEPSGNVTVTTLTQGHSTTHYHYEFLTQAEYENGEDWSAALLGPTQEAGEGGLLYTEAPELSPETEYRFRIAVESSAFPGEVLYSPVKTIPKAHPLEPAPESCPNEVDRYGASARLPDCRAYEQVTPAEKKGAQELFGYNHIASVDTVIGNDGESFLVEHAFAKWGTDVSGVKQNYDIERTPTGWQVHSFAPQPETKQFSLELNPMDSEGFSNFLLERSYFTGLAQSEYKEYTVGPAGGPYTTVAREPNESPYSGGWGAQSRAGNLAVIASNDHELIPGHPTHTVGAGSFGDENDLYAYSARTGLVQVNVETDGEPIGTNGTCGASLADGREAGESGGDRDALGGFGKTIEAGVNTISADGSRVFFYASPGECANSSELGRPQGMYSGGHSGSRAELYMREPFAGKTYDLGHWSFEGANPQGTRLFLGRAVAEGYEYVTYDTETMTAKRAFIVPRAIEIGLGEPGAMSENGNVLYFTSLGELNREATGGHGFLLWRYDLETETLTFISESPKLFFGNHGGPWGAPFTTTQNGEGYYWQNDVADKQEPHEGNEQAFAYDAAEQMILCVSCASPFDPHPQFPSTYLVEGTNTEGGQAPIVAPASANGDFIFFDTPNALLPNDVDGEIEPSGGPFSPSSDIYEWRRYGIDGCKLRQGCLALITNGIDGGRNILLGTDPSGRDVFFSTQSALVAQDKDTVADIYDARIDGGFPPPPPLPLQCEGDSCHNPTNPPNDPTPATSIHKGPGNEHPTPPKEAKPKKHHKAKKKSHKRAHRRAAGHNRRGRK